MSYKKAPAIKKGSHHSFQEKGDISSTFEKIVSAIPRRHLQLVISSNNWEICKKNGWTTP